MKYNMPFSQQVVLSCAPRWLTNHSHPDPPGPTWTQLDPTGPDDPQRLTCDLNDSVRTLPRGGLKPVRVHRRWTSHSPTHMTLNHPIRSRQDSDQSKYKRIREAGENESLVFGGLFRIYWISTACAPPGAPPAPATQAETLQASSFFRL